MTSFRNKTTLAASLLTFASASAFAQHASTPATAQQQPPGATTRPADAKDAVRGRVRRVSKLLDCTVNDAAGSKIGEVEALIIDQDEGYIAYAVVSFGGFLGIKEKLFAIPFSKIVRTDDERCVVADLNKAMLEKAPAFATDAWPTFDRTYGQTLHDYYKATPYWNTAGGIPHQDTTRVTKDALDKANLAAHGMKRASKVIGCEVDSVDGKNLGEIQELVVDDGSGRVIYAVLSFGGFLGMGDKYFAIPWKALKPSTTETDHVVLDVTKERLAAAPGFDQKKWPDMADRRWGSEIHTYYGKDPYWTDEVAPKGELPRSDR